jgi:hypothetical protein
MKATLFVSDDEISRKILIMLQNREGLGEKLKKVKINMDLDEPYLAIGNKKKTGYDDILMYLINPPRQQKRSQQPTPMSAMSYEDMAYAKLYSDNAKSQYDEDDVDDEIKAKRKVQYEEQYDRQLKKLDNPTRPPKRIPIEKKVEYVESMEEQKENELMDYYNGIMKGGGN